MKTIAKAALGALALASLGAVAATPASAQSFGFSFGTGPYYGGYGYGGYYRANPCFRPYPYRPYYCDYGYRGRPYAYGYGRPYRGYYGRPYRYRDPYYRRW